jgi:predicted naringenin-chalcone synthase
MSSYASQAVLAGLGMTDLGRVFGSSQRRLAAAAVRLAVADAGLAISDIDGLLICPGITGGLDVGLAATLGLRDLALLAVINSLGASAVMAPSWPCRPHPARGVPRLGGSADQPPQKNVGANPAIYLAVPQRS